MREIDRISYKPIRYMSEKELEEYIYFDNLDEGYYKLYKYNGFEYVEIINIEIEPVSIEYKILETDKKEIITSDDNNGCIFFIPYNLVYWLEEYDEHIDLIIQNNEIGEGAVLSKRIIKEEMDNDKIKEYIHKLWHKEVFHYVYDEDKDIKGEFLNNHYDKSKLKIHKEN